MYCLCVYGVSYHGWENDADLMMRVASRLMLFFYSVSVSFPIDQFHVYSCISGIGSFYGVTGITLVGAVVLLSSTSSDLVSEKVGEDVSGLSASSIGKRSNPSGVCVEF